MEQSNKAHRKTKEKNTAKKKLHTQGHNAKAFAVSAPGKMARQMQRSSDVNERKLHVPMVDRTPDDDPPPVIVAVVGPPGTGKTTLIKSLIRRMTKTTLNDINGPITVVSGKHRRLTFIECPADDLNSMVDVAKIADLVLLLMDGNFGFEMETMEFLNIAQTHGMPRVLGVTTHLDLFRSQSTLRTSKKRLKHRFWTEVYQGAKLFYLSGVINGRYPDREILNLSRFISVMKFRPLKWRNEHPYLLADRITDLTHPEKIEREGKQIDRKVALYGYLHGTALPSISGTKVHIAGVGDFPISQVEKLPDPCPTPGYQQKLDDYEREKMKEEGNTTVTPKRRKRLDDKDKLIYAPMSDVGGILMDKDAVYINVGKKNEDESFVPGQERGEGEKLVTNLQLAEKSIAENFEGVGIQLFSNGTELHSVEPEEDVVDEEEEQDKDGDKGRANMRNPRVYGKSVQEEDDEIDLDAIPSDDENNDVEEEGEPRMVEIDFENNGKDTNTAETDSEFELSDNDDNWETGVASKLQANKTKRRRKWDIGKLIYMNNIEPQDCIKRWKGEDEDDENEDESDIENEEQDFFTKKAGITDQSKETFNDLEKFVPYFEKMEKLVEKWKTFDSINDRFIGASMKSKKESKAGDSNEDEVFGDFEDLEDEPENEGNEDVVEEDDGGAQSDDSFTNFDKEEKKDLTMDEERELNATKKEKYRKQFEIEEGENFKEDDPDNEFDTWYELQKAKMAKQLEINKTELDDMTPEQRQKIEGYKAGSYVRIVFDDVPMEFIENFDARFPIIMGGLLPTELKFGIIKGRLRRHRWHKKILKTNDPLVISLGWRRFQTLPIYTTTDSRTRTRMLKYTPEHTFCNASFYGPLCSPNTPFCGIQIVANSDTGGGFRIASTGVVEELDVDTEIVKKLKLIGYPYKIFKNTAFIKDMFSSAMEVARFEGAQIKTVSGIRGEIKRALSKPDGHFRATFEDKILMSDTVILRSWYPVRINRFYNPVTSLLLEKKTEWKGVRLTGKIRADMKIETPTNPDSAYKKVERVERRFNGLKIPKAVQRDLPFKSQIHQMKPQKKKTYMAKRAVVMGGEEKKARAFMQKVLTISRAKDEKRKSKKADQRKERLKRLAKAEEAKIDKDKEKKKEYFAKNGKRSSTTEDSRSSKRR
ncbi:GTPase BMS1 [Maudiozyma barnettii]|uniref:Similar to Saccharomyces cerevisiae YPL217C BMS1 GTPase required for synthesis of 40S ribosomal subunits and for processing the 35S pre-rRNA at sites A0, A1, and A2 n=1 Tax=Maudiozyma barnettii TaxID=61262 RepID=A0A8H2VH52_9SACH|nr:GTPase BMS1 [Kazachstania barnettii]CAB4255360.1 similar to Saccharomyces cerevisiae YPL217C BMS1 GTPase required for synthesis of 40S ribosomal subunits and for processing the 35S pre-rRNA at sites A0, A1, and A2 [Kazachstania barnettii]